MPRYELIIERIPIYSNTYICSYKPCYGLVKVNNGAVHKIENYKGHCDHDDEIATVKYVKENNFCLDESLKIIEAPSDDRLSEDEILELINN